MSDRDIKPHNILAAVARANDMTIETLTRRTRAPAIAEPRLIACYLLRTEGRLSFPAIGRLVDRHHTTVMAACKSIAKRLKRWPDGPTARAVGRALALAHEQEVARE
jgi:chromosomal replication initiation ATPase DnaA